MSNVRLDGDVIDIQHGSGSASVVTTATTINVYVGTCLKCNVPRRLDSDTDEDKNFVFKCWDCGTDVDGQRLVIEYKDLDCAHICRHAFHHICHCSCNGVNHAKIWARRLDSSEETEEEALEKMGALLRFRRFQLETMIRAKDKATKDAELREAAFTAWIEQDNREMFVADLLASPLPNLARYQRMVENSEVLNSSEERIARGLLGQLAGGANF